MFKSQNYELTNEKAQKNINYGNTSELLSGEAENVLNDL